MGNSNSSIKVKSPEEIKKDFDDSLAKSKKDFAKSTAAITRDTNNSLATTKSGLDNSLERTKNQVDMGKLQEATGIISKIASINPIVYLSLEAANKASGGTSNKYLNNSNSTNNPLFESVSGIFGGSMGNKILEQPNIDDIGNKLNPLPPIESPSQTDPFAGYSGKYSFLDNSAGFDKTEAGKQNDLKYVLLGVTVGGLFLIMVLSKKK